MPNRRYLSSVQAYNRRNITETKTVFCWKNCKNTILAFFFLLLSVRFFYLSFLFHLASHRLFFRRLFVSFQNKPLNGITKPAARRRRKLLFLININVSAQSTTVARECVVGKNERKISVLIYVYDISCVKWMPLMSQ